MCVYACVFVQELIEKFDVSVLPTFVAVKDGDSARSFALLNSIFLLLSVSCNVSFTSACSKLTLFKKVCYR